MKKKYVKDWTIGLEPTNKDTSIDITYKGWGITAGYVYKDKDVRIGPRFEARF